MTIDIASLVLSSLASLAIGIFVSRHFAARKNLSWEINRRKVLDPAGGNFPSDVEVRFGGKKVERLTEWTVGIWNSGNQPVTSADVVGGSLLLTIERHQIVKITAPKTSRDAVVVEILPHREASLAIALSFLDRGDGFAFTIYTDTNDVDDPDPSVTLTGTILGIPKGPAKTPVAIPPSKYAYLVFVMVLLGYIGFGAACVFFAFRTIPAPSASGTYLDLIEVIGDPAVTAFISVALGVLSALFGAVLIGTAVWGGAKMMWGGSRPVPEVVRSELRTLRELRGPPPLRLIFGPKRKKSVKQLENPRKKHDNIPL